MEPKRTSPGAKNSNVLDLRQAKAAGAARPPARPQSAPARPQAPKPVAKPAPAKPPLPAPPVRPSKPIVQPARVPSRDFVDVSLNARNRFWPAFWRFLFLLILLGLVLTGGLYLYLNYFAK